MKKEEEENNGVLLVQALLGLGMLGFGIYFIVTSL